MDKNVAGKGFLLNKIKNFGPKEFASNMHGRLFGYGRFLFLRKIQGMVDYSGTFDYSELQSMLVKKIFYFTWECKLSEQNYGISTNGSHICPNLKSYWSKRPMLYNEVNVLSILITFLAEQMKIIKLGAMILIFCLFWKLKHSLKWC